MSALPELAPSLRRAGSYPCLLLNADYRPLRTFPLSVWPAKKAVHAVFRNRVTVVREHEAQARSEHMGIPMPSVIVLKRYVQLSRTPAFTRYNVLLRDQWCCAYCGHSFPTNKLTYDHVIPKSRGGKTTWTNIVMACHHDNGRKGNRTPEEAGMPLQWRPWMPSIDDIAKIGARFKSDRLPPEWYEFLDWEQATA